MFFLLISLNIGASSDVTTYCKGIMAITECAIVQGKIACEPNVPKHELQKI